MATLQFTEGPGIPTSLTYRKQLLPNILDGLAAVRPEAAYARMPTNSLTWSSGVRKITYKQLANAVNGMAHWIVKCIGPPRYPHESIAFFGVFDPRYVIMTLAAIKAGFKSIFPALSSNSQTLVKVLQDLDCTSVFHCTDKPSMLHFFETTPGLRVNNVPSLFSLLDDPHPHFEYGKKFEEAKNDPVLVLHTSGSTGTPKPLIYTNDWMASYLLQVLAPPPPGFKSLDHMVAGIDIFTFAPPAHSGALFANVVGALGTNVTLTFPPVDTDFSMQSLLETVKHVPVDLLLPGVALLDAISRDVEYMTELKKYVRMISFGGGPLSKRTGDILTQHFPLFSTYGTSENGTQAKILPEGPHNPELWNCVVPNPADGVDMRPVPGTDNQYELVVVKPSEGSPFREQPVFKLFPELSEWHSKDVFLGQPAPQYGDGFKLFTFSHRLTDTLTLIVEDDAALVDARHINPVAYEQSLSKTDLIEAVLVVGDRRPFPGLLVELTSQSRTLEPSVMKERVWKAVQESGKMYDLAIRQENIIFTELDTPLKRSLKGTVQRAPSTALYEDAITDLYQKQK